MLHGAYLARLMVCTQALPPGRRHEQAGPHQQEYQIALRTGVENVDISVEQQLVKVTSTQPADVILAALQKTGKETSIVS
jgi:pyruvate/oxaloacetate carboxyltransferase